MFQKTRFVSLTGAALRAVTRRKLVACLAGLTAAILWAAIPPNVDDFDVFELDGNPQDATPNPTGEDWTKFLPSGSSASLARTPLLHEADGVSIFTQGGSKDINGIGQWRHTNGAVPDKDDIQNAFAAAYQVPNNGGNDLIVYFGADRTANNGDANIGFWFLQSNVAPIAGGTFSGSHTDGDIFVVSGFTSGGQTSEIDVYRWVGNDTTGSLVLVTSAIGGATCAPSAEGAHVACAISNTGPVPVPSGWTYTPKSGPAGSYPVASFFEGGINVTALLALAGVTTQPCFSTFVVETRSSTSVTAQLKDFIRGDFTLCGLSISKLCGGPGVINGAGTSITYSYNVAVTNTGIGTLSNVTVVDTPNADAVATNVVISPNGGVAASLAAGATANFTVTFNSTKLSAQNSAFAKAALAAGGTPGTCETAGTFCSTPSGDTCTTNPVNSITISKACGVPVGYPGVPSAPALPGTQLISQGGFAVVKVNFSGDVCNTGPSQLTGVTLADVPAADSLNLASSTIGPCTAFDPVTGACTAPTCVKYSGTYRPNGITTPGDLGSTAGRYSFADTINVTGATATIGPSPGAAAGCGANKACAGISCNICPGSPGGLCSGQ